MEVSVILKKITCQHPSYKKKYYLTVSHIELLQMIAYHGFLTVEQMSKYYQMICNDDSKVLSRGTVDRWTAKRSGILAKTTKEHHNMYTLTPWVVKWLCEHMFLLEQDVGTRNPNMHNLLLNNAICNGIYQTWENLLASDYYREHGASLENGFALLQVVRNFNHMDRANEIIHNSQQQDRESFERAEYQQGLPAWLYGLDVRTFNRQMQFDFKDTQELVLKPDAMLKCGNKIIFVELDNRTESNYTLVDKVKTYIDYAIKHPKYLYSMELIFNDGSVRNSKVTQYKIPTRKISMIIQGLMGETMVLNGQRMPVFRAYEYAKNLRVYISPLKESWVDYNDVLLNESLTDQIKRTITGWNEQVKQYRLIVQKQAQKARSRYTRYIYPGCISKANTALRSPKIQIVLGQEHLLDTMLTLLNAVHNAQQTSISPLVIYPYRNISLNALYSTQLVDRSLRNAKTYAFHNVFLLQTDDQYDYQHPTFKLLSHAESLQNNNVPLDEKRFS